MKKVLFLGCAGALLAGQAMSATVNIDLNEAGPLTGTSNPAAFRNSSDTTAESIQQWLNGESGWQGTEIDGETNKNAWNGDEYGATAVGDYGIQVNFINFNGSGGSAIGCEYGLTSINVAQVTGLTLNYAIGTDTGAANYYVGLVYQTTAGWQLTSSGDVAKSNSSSGVLTLSNASGLTSDKVYIFTKVWGGSWGNTELTYSLTADVRDTAAVPEPATATLSLLALAGLAARRRRN